MIDKTKIILPDGQEFLGRTLGRSGMHVSDDGSLLAVNGRSGPTIPTRGRLSAMNASGLLEVVRMSAAEAEAAAVRPTLRRVHCIEDAAPPTAIEVPFAPRTPRTPTADARTLRRWDAGDDLANRFAFGVATSAYLTVAGGYLQYLEALAYLHAARGATDVPAIGRSTFAARVRIARELVAFGPMDTPRGGVGGRTVH